MLSELTFTDLGIPFVLFDAPVSEAAEYKGRDRCSLCTKEALHCFEAGIGDDVIVPCPSCAAEVGLDADARSGGTCAACGAGVGFPDLGDSAVLACYRYLRSGRLALKKDAEFGMIRTRRPCAGSRTACRVSIESTLIWCRCKGPMVYVGQWSRQKFIEMAPDVDIVLEVALRALQRYVALTG